MFEDSLFVSGVSPDGGRSARRRRWITLASVGVQGVLVGSMLAVPLIWPETLPLMSVAPKVTMLAAKKPEVKVEPKPVRVETTNASAMRAPAAAPEVVERGGGHIFNRGEAVAQASDAPSLYSGGSMTGSGPLGAGIGPGPGAAPAVVTAAPKHAGPLAVSTGVMKGMLLAPIEPVYPRIAVAAHIEGTVVVTATIDRQGRIEGLQVLSGPEMLRSAALDAVKVARYKPFLLNGQPTEVITTISVNFRLAS